MSEPDDHAQTRDRAPGSHRTVQCCIAGGGPAGLVAGALLARAGVDVIVLEKHADFLRDFRGDTIHPSTLELMHELGWLESLLQRPHQRVQRITGIVAGEVMPVADFSHLPTRCRFIALMPQWEFLDFVTQRARAYPSFQLAMSTDAIDLRERDGRVIGVRARTPSATLDIDADLVLAADGRHSRLRDLSGLEVENLGAPIDVLWMRLSVRRGDPDQPMGRFDRGRIFVMIYRGEYWQCGYVIAKGAFERIRNAGIDAFRDQVARAAGFARDRCDEIVSFDDVKLLSVSVDRLRRWHRPGLLCIGDAAHAMSPVGGVGINLAIQDAVAASNRLAGRLIAGTLSEQDLQAVARRREWPTRITQWIQVAVQNRVLGRVLDTPSPLQVPLALRALRTWPALQRIPGRLIGLGLRPEHIRSPDIHQRD